MTDDFIQLVPNRQATPRFGVVKLVFFYMEKLDLGLEEKE
jgi:hypothetical protein